MSKGRMCSRGTSSRSRTAFAKERQNGECERSRGKRRRSTADKRMKVTVNNRRGRKKRGGEGAMVGTRGCGMKEEGEDC